jgi:hypothetical protein
MIEIPEELLDVKDVIREILTKFLKREKSKALDEFEKIVEEINAEIDAEELPDTLEILNEMRR